MTESQQLPILLLDNFFLFPGCYNYLPLGKNGSNLYQKRVLLQVWKEGKRHLLVVPSKEKFADNAEEFVPGTLAEINLDLSAEADLEPLINSLKEVQLQGLERIKITGLEKKGEIWYGEYQELLEKKLDEKAIDDLTEKFARYLPDILEKSKLNSIEKLPYMAMMQGNIGKNISKLIDFIAQNSREIDQSTKWKILASSDLQERLEILITLPDRQKIEKVIEEKTREEIRKEQEEYYLRKKAEVIRNELKKNGDAASDEMLEHLERLKREPYPDYVKEAIRKEIKRYEPRSGEAYIIRQYVDWLINLPWWQRSEEIKDLDLVRQRLDEKHYGLTKAKDEIIQHLAAQQQANEPLGEILLLTGPAGVGKSSFAKAVAEAVGRKFGEISLGGAYDVNLIHGFIKTYMGSEPGRLVQILKETGVVNPVILIDEVDKVGHDSHRGSLLYALLAVLDSSRNKKFVDHYLKVPIDLSQVMFICTANSLDLPRPLLDRMKIIHLSSYTELEKLQIAQKHLIPDNLKKFKFQKAEVIFQEQAIMDIIKYYTWGGGVRKLNEEIKTIIKKFSEQFIKKEKEKVVVSSENLKDYLGKRKYEFTEREKEPQIGVATGLAWTENGGDILPIEVNLVPGEGKLGELTGSLGEVMEESAKVAFSYIQSYLEKNKENFEKELTLLKRRNINIHAPEGAVKKDGPSAGITLTTAILSILTDQKVPADIGMTGEITSKGKVLKIGGLKEKAIAAHRSGLKTIIIPKANETDIEDIPQEIREVLGEADKVGKLKIIVVENYEEVWEIIVGKKRKTVKEEKKTNKRQKKMPGVVSVPQ